MIHHEGWSMNITQRRFQTDNGKCLQQLDCVARVVTFKYIYRPKSENSFKWFRINFNYYSHVHELTEKKLWITSASPSLSFQSSISRPHKYKVPPTPLEISVIIYKFTLVSVFFKAMQVLQHTTPSAWLKFRIRTSFILDIKIF